MNEFISIEKLKHYLPKRHKWDHKGKFGHLFILAGSRFYTGAAKMSAKAGMCSGVGLVTLGVPEPVVDVVASGLMEIIFLPLPSTEGGFFSTKAIDVVLECAKDKEAVLLGPGIGRAPETVKFVQEVFLLLQCPLIIDADGLNALSEKREILTQRRYPTLFTPHPGEMARLVCLSTGDVQKDRVKIAITFARDTNSVIVLKGYHTVIANSNGEFVINPTGNHELSKGGTGDILAGLIAGLVAQKVDLFASAQIGTWIHGRSGELAGQSLHPRSVSASDLFTFIHQAWRELDPNPYVETE